MGEVQGMVAAAQKPDGGLVAHYQKCRVYFSTLLQVVWYNSVLLLCKSCRKHSRMVVVASLCYIDDSSFHVMC